MTGTLEEIARELGLPQRCPLRAELHNLLIYGLGRFFERGRWDRYDDEEDTALFARESAARRTAQEELRWFEEVAGRF